MMSATDKIKVQCKWPQTALKFHDNFKLRLNAKKGPYVMSLAVLANALINLCIYIVWSGS